MSATQSKDNGKMVEDNKPVSDGGQKRKNIPAGLWTKCPECQHVIFNKTLKETLFCMFQV